MGGELQHHVGIRRHSLGMPFRQDLVRFDFPGLAGGRGADGEVRRPWPRSPRRPDPAHRSSTLRTSKSFVALVERMSRDRVDALAIDQSPFTEAASPRISALFAQHRLPAIANGRSFADQRLLLTYTVDLVEPFRQAAKQIDEILRDAKPVDLPVEVASKFELTVDTKTAKALGIVIPTALLVRADEVSTRHDCGWSIRLPIGAVGPSDAHREPWWPQTMTCRTR
jgi:putative ABC transport system substrate-binding protein